MDAKGAGKEGLETQAVPGSRKRCQGNAGLITTAAGIEVAVTLIHYRVLGLAIRRLARD
jgi:hypothetical protein